MKKVFALLLCLSLVLSLSVGLTASAEEGFDPNLAGVWVLDKAEDNDSDSDWNTSSRICSSCPTAASPARRSPSRISPP